MPKVNTLKISTQAAGAWHSRTVDVMVNADGIFYCNPPSGSENYVEPGKEYHRARCERRNRGADPQLFADTMKDLEVSLRQIMKTVLSPTVREDLVIRYNIQSNVSFWETSDGQIVPNGGFAPRLADGSGPEGRWGGQGSESDMYGGHHSSQPSVGGYALTIGAEARIKRTETLGERVNVVYLPYYGDQDHFGTEHPAARLNGWCSFSLSRNFKEIPYTDSAAEYFFNLMLGMAKISRMVQENTFDQEKLLKHIETGTSPLLAAPQ